MYQLLLLLTLRLSSSPEKVDGPNGGKRQTPEQNRLLSALEAFYYCIVLLGGDVNSMNKQAVGLGPPFIPRPQTQAEKAAVAARKVQRVVKKRLLREAVAARKVQRVVKKRLLREYELEWEACWGGSTLSKKRPRPKPGFCGVGANGNRWQARINYDGQNHSLGSFDTKEHAAAAHDRAARQQLWRQRTVCNYGSQEEAEAAAAAAANALA
jgi:hypothetical protein